jgi:protein-S-isoprenylcysteine O-methyltransferase Ste14
MSTNIGLAKPLLELKGQASNNDLSTWISGISYTLGILLVIQEQVNVTPDQSVEITFSLIASLAAVFAAALMIQKHIRLSLVANSFGSSTQLRQSGIYQYSRNPIYVVFTLPLLSLSALSLSAAVLAIGFYVTAINVTVLRKEERHLREVFGSNYTKYAAKVPRWVL